MTLASPSISFFHWRKRNEDSTHGRADALQSTVSSAGMDDFLHISDLSALTGPAANKGASHAVINHVGAIGNKQAEAEKLASQRG
jgi:hypothetical protein